MSEELKLEVGKTYVFKGDGCKKLYLEDSVTNEGYVTDLYKEGFTLEGVGRSGKGYISGCVVIEEYEIKYFKEKDVLEKPPQTNNLWGGVSDLEVGMIVGRNCSGRTPFKIKYVGVEYCILESVDDKVEHSVKIGNIMTLQLTHKEETFEKVLSAWNKASLDNAYDNKNAIVGLEDFFNVMYDVMK